MTVSSTISVLPRRGVPYRLLPPARGADWNGRILHTHYATGQQAEAPLNTVISVASVPVATNPPGIRFRTRWTV